MPLIGCHDWATMDWASQLLLLKWGLMAVLPKWRVLQAGLNVWVGLWTVP